MSLDTHKYGYALKGTSVVLYRNRLLRQSQYFCYADWTGGMYTTPTIAGSRSGGLIAQCKRFCLSLALLRCSCWMTFEVSPQCARSFIENIFVTLYPLIILTPGWASLMALGEDGYNQHTRDILGVAQEIAAGVREIKGIRLLGGTPEAMIVCFAGRDTGADAAQSSACPVLRCCLAAGGRGY